MRRALSSFFIATLIVQGTVGFSQDAPADAPAETTTDPATGLSLGEPEGPQVGQTYVAENFGDWQQRCIKAPEGQEDRCNLYQLLSDADGAAVAEFSMFRLPEGSRAVAGATIVAPLETLLTEQLTVSVDGGEARRYPFSFCNAGGCIARVGFTQPEVDQFKQGSNATLRLVPAAAPTQEVMVTVSLNGFTAAYNDLSPRQ